MPPLVSTLLPGTSQLPPDAAYAATLPEMAALSSADLLAVNVDLMSAATTVLGSLPALRALRPQIAKHLPTFDLERFDKLEQYARALAQVHASLRDTLPERSNSAELAAELRKLRDRLLRGAECLVAHELMDGRRLKECKRARGHRGLAADALMLAVLFREHWPQIEGRTPVTTTMLNEAASGAFQLLRAVGEERLPSAKLAEAQLARQRAFTLLFRAYDDARWAVAYLRRSERDAARIAPSLHVGRAGRAGTTRPRDGVREKAEMELKPAEAAEAKAVSPPPLAPRAAGSAALRDQPVQRQQRRLPGNGAQQQLVTRARDRHSARCASGVSGYVPGIAPAPLEEYSSGLGPGAEVPRCGISQREFTVSGSCEDAMLTFEASMPSDIEAGFFYPRTGAGLVQDVGSYGRLQCWLREPRSYRPACPEGLTCTAGGECVASPRPQTAIVSLDPPEP